MGGSGVWLLALLRRNKHICLPCMQYLFIAVFLFFLFLTFLFRNRPLSKKAYWLTGTLLALLAGLRDGNSFHDYENYFYAYKGYYDAFEPSFYLIRRLAVNVFHSSYALFLIYAFLGVGLKWIAIRKMLSYSLLAVMLYLSHYYTLHELTQIRAGVASGLVLLCVPAICDRHFKRFLVLAFLAFLFHYSAVVILPFYFMGTAGIRIGHWLVLIALAYVFACLGYSLSDLLPLVPLEVVADKYQFYVWEKGNETVNIFNPVLIAQGVFGTCMLLFRRCIQPHNRYFVLLLKIYLSALILNVCFADFAAVGYRLSQLLQVVEIVLLPLLLYVSRYFFIMLIGYAVIIFYIDVYFLSLIV